MLQEFSIFMMTAIAACVCAAGLIKAGKVPKMPAFYQKIVREGIFNQLIFKNYFFRKVLEHGKEFPETKLENICSLYNHDTSEF